MNKTIIILVFIFLIKFNAFSQNIDNQNNNLAYDAKTINQLKFIVDSLHLKYKKNPPNKMYMSVPQAKGYTIVLRENTPNLYIDDLMRDLKNKMPLEKLRKKYPNAIDENIAFVTKQKQEKYGKKAQTYFNVVSSQYPYWEVILEEKDYNKKYNNEAVFKYDKSSGQLLGIFILEDFKTQAIPAEYSNMISYSSYMIDAENAISEKNYNREEDISDNKILGEFERKILEASQDYINNGEMVKTLKNMSVKTKQDEQKYEDNDLVPTIDEFEEIIKYTKVIKDLDKKSRLEQKKHIHKAVKSTPNFNKYINDLVNEIIKTNKTTEMIEDYLTPYVSKKQLLEIKRKRYIVAKCSIDSSPITHALEIAKLSAETLSWNLFLRSHLDVMNDYMNRISDINISAQKRKTYLAELEAININVNDLLFGILLSASNVKEGHYYGNANRIGKAFSEAKNQTEIKDKMLNIITNENLDLYNRTTFYYAFCTYNAYIKDKPLQENNQKLLNEILEKPSNSFFKSIVVIKTK